MVSVLKKIIHEVPTKNQDGGLIWQRMLVCSQWLQVRREMASVDEENIENQARGEPCGGLRKELKECLLASDCVKLVC